MNDDSLNVLSKYSRIQPSVALAESVVGSKANHDIEWSIALQSITSVKNEKAFPISADKKVVVLYPSESQRLAIELATMQKVPQHFQNME
ncbi:MAG: hypothetical protein IKW81_05190 [Pseudobutyrivibrio sp.]|nr:hypothetical protein [Pseudobutyrivibrio sp.]